MYLSDIEIVGFKSFAQKTKLKFTSGLSAVVGPNGCGKTNVVDAIRWVLGEKKASTLRSDGDGECNIQWYTRPQTIKPCRGFG